MATPTTLVATLALFAVVGAIFLLVNLLVGKFLRPDDPHAEKTEIYECGEPTIGSSFVQFDLRFYVVALVFIVFDVEVAFLFPLATVQGKAANLASRHLPVVEQEEGGAGLTESAAALHGELGVAESALPTFEGATLPAAAEQVRATGRQLAWAVFGAINVFFAVLLVGFFYEWKTGAFDWVRAVTRERAEQYRRPPIEPVVEEEPALSA